MRHEKLFTTRSAIVNFKQEVNILNKFISAGSICFDIGAGYGRYTLYLSKMVGRWGHIYSFESGSYSWKVLSTIVKIYRLKNVTIVKKEFPFPLYVHLKGRD